MHLAFNLLLNISFTHTLSTIYLNYLSLNKAPAQLKQVTLP